MNPLKSLSKLRFENLSLKLSPIIPKKFITFSQYSDFFPFVNNRFSATTLYAINYSFFIQPKARFSEAIVLSIYDHDGNFLRYCYHALDSNSLFTLINLTPFLPPNSYGSFSVFHIFDSHFSHSLSAFADRSYIGFTDHDSEFIHFVHGNQDAIVFSGDYKFPRLLRASFVPRIYRPQFVFRSNLFYTLIFSNPTKSRLFYIVKSTDLYGYTFWRSFVILPLGTKLLEFPPQEYPFHLTILSNHPFPRPLIITGHQSQIHDVFHS
tara:strand:- start:3060 stop:3854 length:795 start_codon:yes stop_codon:yes gene_type:complete